MSLEDTLKERGENYGPFISHAIISQSLKEVMQATSGWGDLQFDQREALEMIAHKIGRILNGNPDIADHWHDISGYSTLVEKNLNGENL